MNIALISDIHGNKYAFQSVLDDIKTRNIDLTVFLGDLAYGGIYPSECLSMLMDIEPLIAIKGNSDARFDMTDEDGNVKTIVEDNRHQIHCWVESLLSGDDIHHIQAFEHDHTIEVDSYSIGFFHGSPKSYNDRIYEDDSDEEIVEKFQHLRLSAAAVGNTHVRMQKDMPGMKIVNPGAIGISNDRDTRAGYGILTVGTALTYEQKNVEYPLDKYIIELVKSEMPSKTEIASQLQTGTPNKSIFRK